MTLRSPRYSNLCITHVRDKYITGDVEQYGTSRQIVAAFRLTEDNEDKSLPEGLTVQAGDALRGRFKFKVSHYPVKYTS